MWADHGTAEKAKGRAVARPPNPQSPIPNPQAVKPFPVPRSPFPAFYAVAAAREIAPISVALARTAHASPRSLIAASTIREPR